MGRLEQVRRGFELPFSFLVYLCSIANKGKRNSVKVLLLDNYDSFTYNLCHYLEADGAEVSVHRNDAFDWELLAGVDKLVLSPGPGLPGEAGVLLELITRAKARLPILGVCLGMQALAIESGGTLRNLQQVRHGICEHIDVDPSARFFEGFDAQQEVGLYHSWCVSADLPSEWTPTAWTSDGVLMAMEHQTLPLYGVQFHPESVMTPQGKAMIHRFLTKL